jgi:hypothetical protein
MVSQIGKSGTATATITDDGYCINLIIELQNDCALTASFNKKPDPEAERQGDVLIYTCSSSKYSKRISIQQGGTHDELAH